MTKPAPRRRGVQSLDRAVAILRTFDRHHSARGVTETARLVGLTPSTTHRLLASLQEHGLVRKDPQGRYTLGPELLRLAQVARDTVTLTDIARPVMSCLRDQTNETVALHVADLTPARIVLDHGSDPEIRKLSQEVIAAQESEIAFLEKWLERQKQR
jgi:IclR family transcriptional regulator, acetate operon repressor